MWRRWKRKRRRIYLHWVDDASWRMRFQTIWDCSIVHQWAMLQFVVCWINEKETKSPTCQPNMPPLSSFFIFLFLVDLRKDISQLFNFIIFYSMSSTILLELYFFISTTFIHSFLEYIQINLYKIIILILCV